MLVGLSLRAWDHFHLGSLNWQRMSEPSGSTSFVAIFIQLGFIIMLAGVALGLLDLGFSQRRTKR